MLDVGERLAVSEHRLRSFGGGDRCDQCGSRLTCRGPVPSAVGGVLGTRCPLEHLGQGTMQRRAPGRRQVLCERLAQERVADGVGTGPAVTDEQLTIDARPQCGVGAPGDSPAAAAVTASSTGRAATAARASTSRASSDSPARRASSASRRDDGTPSSVSAPATSSST